MGNGERPFSEDTATLPSLKKSNWTLLVQGVDLHDGQVHALKNQFRFAPDARLDDVMISFATDGGGVGPHFDSYDVFLLQARQTPLAHRQAKRLDAANRRATQDFGEFRARARVCLGRRRHAVLAAHVRA